MIHVITKHNRHLYYDVLEDMHRLRHKIFVEERGWKKLTKPDGLEIDQFDTLNTTYFLKLSPDMKILGGMRIYPTTVPTQLNTIFRNSCVLANPPCSPLDYEWSRYFIADTTYRSATGKPVHYELYTGILEYAHACGIRSLSGFIETQTFVRSGRMPWDMRQLGIPMEYGGTDGEEVGSGLPIQLMLDKTMVRKTKIGWRMVKPVLSLSLGELTPYGEKGFKPEVVLALEDFVKEHPEHLDAIASFAAMLQSVDPGEQEAAKAMMSIMSEEEALAGFDLSLIPARASETHTVTLQ